MKLFLRGFLPLFGIAVVCLVTVLQLGMFTARYHSNYRPGDCLGHPVPDTTELEWWEEPPTPTEILMITDVGEHHYRFKGWGAGGLSGSYRLVIPHGVSLTGRWYSEYDKVKFAEVDDRRLWSPVPCPEQGPDPDGQSTVNTTIRASSGVIEEGATLFFTINSNGSTTQGTR